jgi:hypothetical protein
VAFPYIAYMHRQTGIWSISPEATALWGIVLDYEQQVYGNRPGSMGNPMYHSILSYWLSEPETLMKLVSRNLHVVFIRHFHALFPLWFLVPALLGFLFAPPAHARRNLFLVAMSLPLAIQFLHNVNYRHIFPVLPLLAIWVPVGVRVLAACMGDWLKGLHFSLTLPGSLRSIQRVCWAGLICLLIAPTVAHAIMPEDLPLEHKRAGLWIRQTWGTGKVIMSRKPWVSFYSGGLWHAIPYDDLGQVLVEAKKKGVEFLVLDERTIPQTRPQLTHLLSDGIHVRGLEQVYQENVSKKIVIYQISNSGA